MDIVFVLDLQLLLLLCLERISTYLNNWPCEIGSHKLIGRCKVWNLHFLLDQTFLPTRSWGQEVGDSRTDYLMPNLLHQLDHRVPCRLGCPAGSSRQGLCMELALRADLEQTCSSNHPALSSTAIFLYLWAWVYARTSIRALASDNPLSQCMHTRAMGTCKNPNKCN